MKALWVALGRIGFWLTLPLLAMYLSYTKRTRIVLRVGDEILVQKTWLGDGSWILPGGGLHTHEDIATGAARELYEECGIVVEPIDLHHEFRAKVHFKLGVTIDTTVFSLHLPAKPRLIKQKLEINELAWVRIDELYEAPHIGPIIKKIVFKA